MLFTFFLILLLTRMSVGEIMFRNIFLTPFGHTFETDPLPDLCGGVTPAGISFLKYWSDELLTRLPSCDCIWDSESSETIGEDMFRAIFLTPFGLEWNSQGRIKPSEEISYWHYWVAEEKPTKDVGTQTELAVNKATQTEDDSAQSKNSWWLLEHSVFTRKRKSKY